MRSRRGSGKVMVFTLAPVLVALGLADGCFADELTEGRDLFLKEWVPGIASVHGGDGVGPAYNETSCVACHNQGGRGGAGPVNRNVDLVAAVVTADESGRPRGLLQMFSPRARKSKRKPPAKTEAPDRGPLIELHAGFRESASVVVHRYGPDPDHESWRLTVLQPDAAELVRVMAGNEFAPGWMEATVLERAVQFRNFGLTVSLPKPGKFTLVPSQRNPSALFGAGLIDAIPDEAIIAAAKAPNGFVEIHGRPARMRNGRIGRFGWKDQTATLDEFVRTACAVELGLEVPGHHQGIKPRQPEYQAPGLDLTERECAVLTAFVRALPAPVRLKPADAREAELVRAGEAHFRKVGCVACHREGLGGVEGIYSDLLLHDMGDELADGASYDSSSLPDPSDPSAQGLPLAAGFPSGPDAFVGATATMRGASRREWRTPPLWGLRDSAPYLHDGRAETLEQAIALHHGEAQSTRQRYFSLPRPARGQVLAFLKSLAAPPQGNDHGQRLDR